VCASLGRSRIFCCSTGCATGPPAAAAFPKLLHERAVTRRLSNWLLTGSHPRFPSACSTLSNSRVLGWKKASALSLDRPDSRSFHGSHVCCSWPSASCVIVRASGRCFTASGCQTTGAGASGLSPRVGPICCEPGARRALELVIQLKATFQAAAICFSAHRDRCDQHNQTRRLRQSSRDAASQDCRPTAVPSDPSGDGGVAGARVFMSPTRPIRLGVSAQLLQQLRRRLIEPRPRPGFGLA